MKSWLIPRRTFLKGAGTSLLLPMLDIMCPNDAAAEDLLKPRFTAIYLPQSLYGEGYDASKSGVARYFYAKPYDSNGQGAWRPTTTGNLPTQLPPILDVLKSHRGNMLVVSGLSWMPKEGNDVLTTHSLPPSSWLTCGWDSSSEAVQNIPGTSTRRSDAPPTSVDQVIANHLKYTPGSSIVFNTVKSGSSGGGQERTGGYMGAISYNERIAGNHIVSKSNNPLEVFRNLFRNCTEPGTPAPAGPTPTEKMHENVLDRVSDSIKDLNKKLSKNDRERMDAYLQNIEDLQRTIAGVEDPNKPLPTKCYKESDVTPYSQTPEWDAAAWYNQVCAMVDVIAFASASEAMPIATLMPDNEARNSMRYASIIQSHGNFIGIDGNQVKFPSATWSIHNDVAHQASMKNGSGYKVIEQYITWTRLQMQFTKRLMDKLGSMPAEPNGLTPLENAVILTGAGHSNGNGHTCHNVPILISGGKRYGFKQGQHVALPMKTDLGDLHYTVLKSMGVPLTNFNGHSKMLASVLE